MAREAVQVTVHTAQHARRDKGLDTRREARLRDAWALTMASAGWPRRRRSLVSLSAVMLSEHDKIKLHTFRHLSHWCGSVWDHVMCTVKWALIELSDPSGSQCGSKGYEIIEDLSVIQTLTLNPSLKRS